MTTDNGGSLEARRRKLLFRCRHRGSKELDLVFGAFASAHLYALGEGALDELDRLLNAPDDDLYAWLRGHCPVPDIYASPVFEMLKAVCDRKNPAWNV